jgi:hypothetical protein
MMLALATIPLLSLASLAAQTATPSLPIDLGALSGWAAGQVGVPPLDTADEDLDPGTIGRHDPHGQAPATISIDLDQIADIYGITTGSAMLVLTQMTLIHEYLHEAGLGQHGGSGWEHSEPPTSEDCEHYQIHLASTNFLCDSIFFWKDPATDYEKKVLEELCAVHAREAGAINDTIGGFLPGCAGTGAKTVGGIDVPAISTYASGFPDCENCPATR